MKRALSSGADEYVMAVVEKLSDQDLLDDPTIAPLMAEAEEPTFLEYVARRTSIEHVIADGVRFPSIMINIIGISRICQGDFSTLHLLLGIKPMHPHSINASILSSFIRL